LWLDREDYGIFYSLSTMIVRRATIPDSRLSRKSINSFQQQIMHYYDENKRGMPWRDTVDPYCILVSEFMLQQTQVERVLLKYVPFITRFPDFQTLSRAGLKDVLTAWQGLGYNRRAINLKETAGKIISRHSGRVPEAFDELIRLPGIGKATAGSILAFAYNKPSVFIETNIRRVFIHFFFQDKSEIQDKEIMPIVEKTLDHENPRHWYYALMDYGAMIKKETSNPNRKSATYSRQEPFEGSNRQARGALLRHLLNNGIIEKHKLITLLGITPDQGAKIISSLEKEGFLYRCGDDVCLRS
jgi:A/G-specific adenine glycosylase